MSSRIHQNVKNFHCVLHKIRRNLSTIPQNVKL